MILVAYAPDIQQAVFGLYNGFRKDKKASLNVAALKGHAVETRIGSLSADEQNASDSVWTGRVAGRMAITIETANANRLILRVEFLFEVTSNKINIPVGGNFTVTLNSKVLYLRLQHSNPLCNQNIFYYSVAY